MTTLVDLEGIIPSETNQPKKILYGFMYYVDSKNKTNEQTRKQTRVIAPESKLVVAGSEGSREKETGRLRGANFQLQHKRITGMKCTAWGIYSITMSLCGDR